MLRAPKPTVPPVAPPSTPHLFAGTSGWAYPTWKPGFYPPKLPQKDFLSFFSSQLTSVEVNYTFRALPTPTMLEGWIATTPSDFRFSFKAPQRITHFSRLRDCAATVQQFVSALEPVRQACKLGLLLFQLPPNFKVDIDRLAELLRTPALRTQSTPVALEFRHETWFAEPIYTLLAEHNAALCVAESDDLVSPEVHPAQTHACFRLRRNGGYTPHELESFATHHIALAAAGRDVYTYFKHEDEPTGALNARQFLAAAQVAHQVTHQARTP